MSKTAASAISTSQTSVGIVISNNESAESEEPNNTNGTTEAKNTRPDASVQLSSLTEANKKAINRRRNVTRLVSTGEPPGLLQRQLRGISFAQSHLNKTNIN